MAAPSFAYYAIPEGPTMADAFARDLERLPDDIGAICEAVQGLLMHQAWAAAYGSSLDARRQDQQHQRSIAGVLAWLHGPDGLTPSEPRVPDNRYVCVCQHFTVLTTAILRAKGMPARARCGFAGYFDRSYFCDHWVVEYRDEATGQWKLADAQLDPLQVATLGVTFDPLDVPRDQFVIAGSAWTRSRAGEVSAQQFGLFEERGNWLIASNMIRDAAALNKLELLPWDDWPPMPPAESILGDGQLEFFDHLAALTLAPDENFDALRSMHADGAQLALPTEVFNAIRQRLEPVNWAG